MQLFQHSLLNQKSSIVEQNDSLMLSNIIIIFIIQNLLQSTNCNRNMWQSQFIFFIILSAPLAVRQPPGRDGGVGQRGSE